MSLRELEKKDARDGERIEKYFYDYWEHRDLPRRYGLFKVLGPNLIYVGYGEQSTQVYRWKGRGPGEKYVVGFGGTARLRYQLGFTESYIKSIKNIYKGPDTPTPVSFNYTLSDFLVESVAMVYRSIIKMLHPINTNGLVFRYNLFTLDGDMDVVLLSNRLLKLTSLHSSYSWSHVFLGNKELEPLGFRVDPGKGWYAEPNTYGPNEYEGISKDHREIVEELRGVKKKIEDGKETGVKLDALLERKRNLEELVKDFREESGENFGKVLDGDVVLWDKIEKNLVGTVNDGVRTIYRERIVEKKSDNKQDIQQDIVVTVVLSTIVGYALAKKIIG